MNLNATESKAASPVPARIGWWSPNGVPPIVGEKATLRAIEDLTRPVQLVEAFGRYAVAENGSVRLGADTSGEGDAMPLIAYAPPLAPDQLGDPEFRRDHKLRFAYVAGAMANGIGSTEIVESMARAGMVGFFGAAGLSLSEVEAAIDRVQSRVGNLTYGFNLIHSPDDAGLEDAVSRLYLRRHVRLVSASAYLDLTLPLVRYRLTGITAAPDGTIVVPNKVIAKVSRVEVARRFFSPPPDAMIDALVQDKTLTSEQGQMARRIPVAQDLTAEADSGGHTDNRPLIALLPTMLSLRDQMQTQHGYGMSLRVGAAGGIATPSAAAAAYSMGAAYVLTGSINQACVEAGTSQAVRQMLASASQSDVTMAPAADMFEMGVKVQVLKWGTMFAVRARKLYDLYREYDSLDALPDATRTMLERDFFRSRLDEVWEQTQEFFAQRDPGQIARSQRDPKHKMALLFRSYLGQSSTWANAGEPSRRADYQIWCGPAMGAFNEWVRGSVLESPDNRNVVTVALNLLVGAAAMIRVGWLRAQGAVLPASAQRFAPRALRELHPYFPATA